MKDSKGTDRSSLPPSLKKQLAGLRWKLCWAQGSKAICAALGLLLVSLLIVFGSDRLWDTPQPLLLLFSLTGWASAAWVLALGYRFAIAQPRYDENLAKTAQTRFPAIGDRLLGVIELCDPTKKISNHSAALRKAAVAQVAEEVGRVNLGQAVELNIVKRVAAGFAGLVIITAVCAAIMPQATSNAFARWVNPLDPTSRYTFAKLTSFPTNKIVARGEPFQVLCTIDPNSFWLPEQATLKTSDGSEHMALLNGTSYLFEFDDVRDPVSFTLKVGDARGAVKVTPLARPSLKQSDAVIRYPDYLGYPNERKEITNYEFNVPLGSTLTVDAFANRPLSEAIIIEESGDRRRIAADIDAQRLTVKIGRVEQDQIHRLYWRDVFGLSCSGPQKLKIIAQEDEPPTVDFPERPTEFAVLENEILNLTAKAVDDYGIHKLAILWTLRNTGAEETETLEREWVSDSTAVRSLEGTHPLSPALLGAPAGSIFAIRAQVTDWRIDAEPVFSRELLAHVMSVETHAELIRNRMEEILAQLSEIARLEEDILLETLKLEALDPEKALEEAAQRKAEETAAKQGDLSEKLNSMSEEGVENLREAMKNPLFTEQTLSEWNQTMQDMQELAEGKMQEASQQLSQASSSSSQSQSSESLSEAEQTEREILEELQNLQGEINEQLDELEALTLAQRLRKIKRTEDSLDESLTKNLGETIGLRPENLPAKQKLLWENLHEQQYQTHLDSKTLKGEISRYHERTNKPQYGQVSEEMEESEASEGLRSVAKLINRNISLGATEKLRHWAVKFEGWAKLLEPEEGGGGGGGGGGGEGQDITEQLIALLRIRQGEAELRRNTMLLEKEKSDVGKKLEERSDELGSRQRELMVDLTDVQIELAQEPLNPLFDDSHTAMADAASKLEKQDSGNETVTAETQAFDLVSDIINLLVESQCQSSSSSQSQADTASAMQFLLQQYGQGEGEGQGMGMSSFGGGSNQGGDTDSNPAIPRANQEDSTPGDRHFRKASGWSSGLPSEFRDALEHYFKEIEQ